VTHSSRFQAKDTQTQNWGEGTWNWSRNGSCRPLPRGATMDPSSCRRTTCTFLTGERKRERSLTKKTRRETYTGQRWRRVRPRPRRSAAPGSDAGRGLQEQGPTGTWDDQHCLSRGKGERYFEESLKKYSRLHSSTTAVKGAKGFSSESSEFSKGGRKQHRRRDYAKLTYSGVNRLDQEKREGDVEAI